MMSLGGGLLFGTLLAYGAYRTSNDPKDFLFLLGMFLGYTSLCKRVALVASPSLNYRGRVSPALRVMLTSKGSTMGYQCTCTKWMVSVVIWIIGYDLTVLH